jgi:preprotein translocase subunit SecD
MRTISAEKAKGETNFLKFKIESSKRVTKLRKTIRTYNNILRRKKNKEEERKLIQEMNAIEKKIPRQNIMYAVAINNTGSLILTRSSTDELNSASWLNFLCKPSRKKKIAAQTAALSGGEKRKRRKKTLT